MIVKCPKCKSNKNVIKRGWRYNKGTGKVQKYQCKKCVYKFIVSINYHMRHRRNLIDKAINLRKEGNTYAQIAKKLRKKISRQTVNRWVIKYKDWKTKEMDIKFWSRGYWNKQFSKPVWVKGHYSTWKSQI